MHERPRRPVSLGALPAAGVCHVSHPLGCESLMCANMAGHQEGVAGHVHRSRVRRSEFSGHPVMAATVSYTDFSLACQMGPRTCE